MAPKESTLPSSVLPVVQGMSWYASECLKTPMMMRKMLKSLAMKDGRVRSYMNTGIQL